MAGTRTIIEASSLGKVYRSHNRSVTALEDVTFDVDRGEFFGIIGPSGCGKSTLLRIFAKLIEPTTGDFQIFDQHEEKPENAMVFQDDALFPWRSVQKNVEFGMEMRGIDRAERRKTALEYIERVGLAGFEDSYPHQLSGGMKQRVNIIRAFANDPEVLLMDEPLGALDAQTRYVLQEQLLEIWEEEEKTVLYVTHSLEEAILMCDRIALISSRPGTIKDIYEVDIPRPREPTEVRNSARFNEMYSTLWSELEEEVRVSMEID